MARIHVVLCLTVIHDDTDGSQAMDCGLLVAMFECHRAQKIEMMLENASAVEIEVYV